MLAPAMVQAQSPFSLVWAVQPAEGRYPLERDVADGEVVLRQKLLPLGLAVLGADVALPRGSRLVARRGAQLVRVGGPAGRIHCALETERTDRKGVVVPNKTGTTLCLLDGDGDGRFEGAFEGTGSVTGVIVDALPPKQPVVVDVAYEKRPVEEFVGDYWVGVRYEQYFNVYGNRMLFTDFGGRGAQESLTAFDTFKSKGIFPREVEALGAKLTILSAAPKGVRVRIDRALPPQPFSVVRTTTYRIY